MNTDLERLLTLQRLDTTARDAEQRLADEPTRLGALDARLDEARARVASAKERLTESQNARRAIEKDVALHQGRLSKFREQAMAVKTNQEYHAIQHEIGFADSQVKALEDQILEKMLEGDELAAGVKRAEAELGAEQKAVEGERAAIARENSTLEADLTGTREERKQVAARIDPQVLATFELVSSRRHGIGIAEARAGICTICHVRLRPQVFNTVMRNEQIMQCDSCNRILYFVPAQAAAAAPSPAAASVSSPAEP